MNYKINDMIYKGLFKRLKFIIQPFERLYLFNLTVCFCIGVVLSDVLSVWSFLVGILAVMPCCVLAAIFVNNKRKYLTILVFSTLFLLCGVLRYKYLEYLESSFLHISTYNGLEVELRGIISREIDRGKGKVIIRPAELKILEKGRNSSGFRMIGPLDGEVLIKLREVDSLGFGDEMIVLGRLEEPEDFDKFAYKEYLRAKGIYSIIKQPQDVDVSCKGSNLLVRLKRFKRYISNKIERVLPEPHSSLLSGIVFGGGESMSIEFSDKLRKTGTTHIIAVSGYNITVVISSLGIFASLIGRRKLSALSIVFILFFMFFVGVDNIPVVRASLMGITLMVGQLLGKKRVVLCLLPLTVGILLFENPLTYKLLSFQLSFLSTVGLILFTNIIEERIGFIPEFTREDVACTFAAILFTLPVTLSNFGEVSIIAPLVNFFVLPLVPIITIYGFLLILSLILLFPIGKIGAWFAWLFLEYMIKVIMFFGAVDLAMVEIGSSLGRSIGYLLSIILVGISLEVSFRNSENNL